MVLICKKSQVAMLLMAVAPMLVMGARHSYDDLPEVDVESPLITGLVDNTDDEGITCGDGFYGYSNEGTMSYVNFNYEIETNDIACDLEGVVIPALEVAMAEEILPELFLEGCGGGRSRKLSIRRSLATTLLGLSVNGQDKIVETGCLSSDDESCTMVSGEMTIFTKDIAVSNKQLGELDAVGTTNQIRALLQNSMTAGDFNNVAQCVTKVTFVDSPGDGLEKEDDPVAPANTNNGGVSPAVYIAVSGGLVLIVAAAIIYKRRRNASLDGTSTLTPDPSPADLA